MLAEQTTLKPFWIGDIKIDTPLTLAPMAGQTNHAFRTLCREGDECGLVCTELISSHALQYKSSRKKTLQMFDWRPDEESPFAVQLFGHDAHIMAEAAQLVVEYGADIVDINMGCWVPKIAKNGAGAAMMRDVCTAAAVVETVVNTVDVPVTVKIRNGWEPDNPTAVPFAIAAEEVGVKAIAVHGRFANQGHKGEVDWDYIRQVKEAVNIPVIGNGDIVDAKSALRMFELTGCDAVMIGRASLGNPWIFQQIAHEIRTGEPMPLPSDYEKADMAVRQARLTLETTLYPEIKAIRELRGQLLKYVFGMKEATRLRENICSAVSLEDIENAFAPVLSRSH